ncbi:hypothetical protein acdb102_17690 [Acidothermaceae bacterium B102]|nr:hypothetical protein acdb102_17690 [Acidothermaceae bacterium B102]
MAVASHNGSAAEQVRVSTVKRVKGMEFKHVFCVRVDPLSLRAWHEAWTRPRTRTPSGWS